MSRLKLDENLSRHLKSTLAALPHDVKTTAGDGLLSRSDREVAGAAAREDRMLLTLDLEFADLRKYPPGKHLGIVLFRPRTCGPLCVNEFVEQFVRSTELTALAGCVVVVEHGQVRVRRPEPKKSATSEHGTEGEGSQLDQA
jgi:predicted nuclease of predicted toxin-antitoxin system